MITKTQFCNYLVEQYRKDNSIHDVEHIHEMMCYSSSCLAVALEYLKKIESPEIKAYAASRDGLYITTPNDNNGIDILTVREVLNMLPETII